MKYFKSSIYFLMVLYSSIGTFSVRADEVTDANTIKHFFSSLIKYSDVSNDEIAAINQKRLKKSIRRNSHFFELYSDKGRYHRAIKLVGLTQEEMERIEASFGDLPKLLEQFPTQNPAGQLPKPLLDQAIRQIPESAFLQVALNVNHIIETKVTLKNQEALKKLIDAREGLDLTDMPEKLRNSFKMIIENYFDHLPLSDKRRIMVAYLDLPVGSRWDQVVGGVLNSSGPAIQKLFQLLGNDTKSERLKSILNELKSNIKPMSDEDLQLALNQNFGDRFDDLFESFDRTPIAAASIGQVHRAKLKSNQQEVIVKLQRVGLESIVTREFSTLTQLTSGDPIFKKIIGKVQESILEELDFDHEASALDQGQGYNDPKKGIFAVKRISIPGVGKNALIMEKAPGKSLDKISTDSRDQCIKLQALTLLLGKWANRAIFEDGFFHGDLHAGNVFMETYEDQEFDLPEDEYVPHRLTLIDFGNAATMNPQERDASLKLILGTMFNSYDMIEEVLSTYGSNTHQQNREHLRNYFQELKSQNLSYLQVMDQLGAELVNLGVDLPKNLIMFNRGRMFLEKQIHETTQALKDHPGVSCPAMKPEEIYLAMGIRRYPAAWLKSKLGFGNCPAVGVKECYRLAKDFFIPQVIECTSSAIKGTLPVDKGKMNYLFDFLKGSARM